MTPQYTSTDELIQAAKLTPAFIGAYKAAPASIRIGDKVFERDAARSASERVWYLAAVAMINPKAAYAVGNQGAFDMALGLDETQIELDPKVTAARDRVTAVQQKVAAAEKEFADARKDHDKVKRDAAAQRQQIAAGEEEIRNLQAQIADAGRIKDAGDFFAALGTMGASKLGPWADYQIRLEQMKKHVAQAKQDLAKLPLAAAEAEIKAAQQRLQEAKSELEAAQKAVSDAEDAVRARLRKAEDEARIAEAKKKSEEAAERARAAAEERQRQAQAEWEAWQASGDGSYGDYGAGGEYVEPEWQSTDWATTDPDAELGDTEWLDEDELEVQADLYGDEDEARKMAWLNDEPIIGVNTRVSPYSLDGYYEPSFSFDDDPVFGNDTAALVSGIVAGVLTMAPAIIDAVVPPPSKGDSAADPNAGSGKLGDPGEQGKMAEAAAASKPASSGSPIDDFLVKIGLKKTINDAAAAAGSSAGQSGAKQASQDITGIVLGGVVVGGLIFIALR